MSSPAGTATYRFRFGFSLTTSSSGPGPRLALGTAGSSDSEVDFSSPEPGVAPVLTEGVLWDCAEVFRGDGNWSECMIAEGLRVHDGFDRRFSAARDFCSIELFRLLLSLVLRRVVRIWHFGLPCVSWGTLRHPRVRSKYRPFGFTPSEPFTTQHNLIAIRVAFLMWLAHFNGQWASDEQPGGSVLHYLDIFQRLLREEEWTIPRWRHCSFGSPFLKPRQWLHNEPWLLALPRGCSCGRRGRRFKAEGSFTPERFALFESICVGGSAAVYRVPPRLGQSVASFSGLYPRGAMRLMAKGAVRAVAAAKRDPSGPAFRPRHVAPDWVCEFIESARFHPVIAYDFARPAHINCLESRTVKTLTKLACRTSPDTCIATLIDSRVTIGAGAKGRSSSSALNRIQQVSLGYVLGGGLYIGGLYAPLGIHRADDPTRHRAIRSPRIDKPAWLSGLESECFSRLDIVLFADRLCRPWNLWRRLLLLAGVGSSEGGEAGGFAQPSGVMARRVDAAPLLRHLGVAAAPPLGPPPTTSKAQPKAPARPPTWPTLSQDFRPLNDFPLVGSPEYEQADDYTRARAREAANWRRAYARWAAVVGDTFPADASPSDTSPAIILEEFPEPEAPERSAIPLPRMLVSAGPRPPPPRPLPGGPGLQPLPPRPPPIWPWPQPGPLTLPRPAFGGRKAAPARARAGLSAKYAPPVAASLDRPAVPPSRPVPETRGLPPPHEPPALHLRGDPASRPKGAHSPLRLEDAESVHSSSITCGPGSDFALRATGKGGAHPPSDEGHLEAPGLRLLRMSSLHVLGSRTRGSSGSAFADAAHLVPGLSASAAASAAATASALRTAGDRATPVNRSDAQAEPQAALRALAKSRSLRRLERDVEAGAGSMKALKRRARARERAEVHRGSQRGTSSAMTERRSAEEHFGRSAATQAAEEAAELASLGLATLGLPKRARESAAQKQRRRLRRRLKRSRRLHGSDDSDEQLRQDAALSVFLGRDQPPYWSEARELFWTNRHQYMSVLHAPHESLGTQPRKLP